MDKEIKSFDWEKECRKYMRYHKNAVEKKARYYFKVEQQEAEIKKLNSEIALLCDVIKNYQAKGIKLQPFPGKYDE